jgi:hypothetical protein
VSSARTEQELRRIGDAADLQIASRRRDGSLRPYVTIWTVRADKALYVRSAHSTDNPWFRRATGSGYCGLTTAPTTKELRWSTRH